MLGNRIFYDTFAFSTMGLLGINPMFYNFSYIGSSLVRLGTIGGSKFCLAGGGPDGVAVVFVVPP